MRQRSGSPESWVWAEKMGRASDRGPVDAWRWRGDGAGQCAAFQAGLSRPPPEFAVGGAADSQWDCQDSDSPSNWLMVGPISRETSTQGIIIGIKIQLFK